MRSGDEIVEPVEVVAGEPDLDSKKFLDDLRACVRMILKDSDGKLDMEVKNITYAWAHA